MTRKVDHNSEASPVGLLRYAFEYYAAAQATDEAIGDDHGHEIHAPMVVNFLMGQSIELALKAFLLHSGIEIKALKENPYRHDLVTLFNSAIEKNLISEAEKTEEILEVIKLLCEPYKKRELQYYRSGIKEKFPVYGPLQNAGRVILASVFDNVPGANQLKERKAVRVFFGGYNHQII
jgi:hypothetical protein